MPRLIRRTNAVAPVDHVSEAGLREVERVGIITTEAAATAASEQNYADNDLLSRTFSITEQDAVQNTPASTLLYFWVPQTSFFSGWPNIPRGRPS